MSAPTPAPSVSPPQELAPKPPSAATATLYASRAPNPLPRLTHRQSIPTPTPIPCRAPIECESEALAFTEKSITPTQISHYPRRPRTSFFRPLTRFVHVPGF